ncbi:MAG: phosphoribosylformylglycinamidine synthase subunit PurL [Candidatus Omnitrophica bacterium]|nr:phosphoribosylformylglycinamidine synthase subunit PurL [Candidatus Omnitrophota bacterium]
MQYKIEIEEKPGIFDAVGSGIKNDIADLGIRGISDVRFIQVFTLEGSLSKRQVTRICQELLADPVSQRFTINPKNERPKGRKDRLVVEIAYNPGVMDPVEESTRKGIRDLGIAGASSVKTAKKYILHGKCSPHAFKIIAEKLLYNKLIQHAVTQKAGLASDSGAGRYQFHLKTIALLEATEAQLKRINKEGQLFLNLEELRTIQRYFKKRGCNPTDCELETIAQTWSEHCGHKTFRGKIRYTERTSTCAPPRTREIDNLLKSTIMKVTKELSKPWCVSVFKDNAGVIEFDKDYNVCFKVETHNHPSALEPFGGANTGIGGVIRDPLGTGLGAKPILNTDVFCFGPPQYPFSKLPAGTLHPKRVMKGVVSGVRDYGNKMGIPTVNGAVLFHDDFIGNPLVYCGTVGIMPKDKSFKEAKTDDLIVVVGGKTGRDGIHGATFSSGELTHESDVRSSGAVQIGNPIEEKKMVDTILQARDKNLYSSITDCGAGGLSSAVGEMGQELGAQVYLEKVPLKYEGLSYTEIWISESQERMVLAVPPGKIEELLAVFSSEDVGATVIGIFTDTKRLKLLYQGNPVCDLDMVFLHEGLPKTEKKAVYIAKTHPEPRFKCPRDLTPSLRRLLGHYDICSKEWVIRQYDHEVQGGSILKPLVGVVNDGPSDASVVKPRFDSSKGLIISCGINFRFGFIDPYWMAASVIEEALRQIVAVGGSLERVAILDNFCWGNPDKPDRLGSLVRASYGCYDAAKAFGVPFISGKDSLNNEFTVKGKSIAIPGTLLISAIAVIDDVQRIISMYAKNPGDLIYVVGETFEELGGSHYFDLFGKLGNSVPLVNFPQAKAIFRALDKAAGDGLVTAMHDCSDGGIGVAAAEMAFAGNLGMDLFLSEVPYRAKNEGLQAPSSRLQVKKPAACGMQHEARNDFILFSESNSRFIVEVPRKDQKSFEALLKEIPWGLIGCVSDTGRFTVYGIDNKVCIESETAILKEDWQKPLRW